MTTQTSSNRWHQVKFNRWQLLAAITAVLFIMAFYALSDVSRLAHNHALAGSDWVGAALCHRITDRSFSIAGRQFPLCARCTGMYLGVMLTFVLVGMAGRLKWGELPPLKILLVLIAFVGLMGIDGINSYTHFFPTFPHVYTPRNWLRLLTGIGTGLAMGLVIIPMLAQTLWRLDQYQPVIGSFRELGMVMGVAGTAVLLLLSNQPAINYVLAVVSTLGVLTIVTAINIILLLTLIRKDGLAVRWQQTAVPLAAGLALAIIELSLIAYMRLQLTGTITGIPGL